MDSSNTDPLVSVILPTYNRREYLAEAIETVNKQTYNEIELIIIDDHSSESPRDIVESAPCEGLHDIMFLQHEENRGASAARNTGIKRANGQYIALLDDDDLWTPNKIERQITEFRHSEDDIGVVCTGIRSIDADGSTIRTEKVQFEGNITKQLLLGSVVPLPSMLVRRDIICDAGFFDERLRLHEDQEWTIRLSQNCEFRSIEEPMVISRRDDIHVQLSDDIKTKIEESYPLVMEKCRPIAAEYGRLFEQKMVAHWSFRLGYASLANDELAQARKYIRTAILTWPFVPEFYLYGLFAVLGNRWYTQARTIKRRIEHYRYKLMAET